MFEADFLNGTLIPFNTVLGDSLGRGATAKVHSVIVGDRRFAAKIYNTGHTFDEEKILSMCRMGYPSALPTNSFAWPLAAIKNNGRFCGYLMPSFETADHYPLSYYFDATFFKKIKSNELLSLSNRVEIARSLCRAIAAIHSTETYFIDLKPQNILVNWRSNACAMLDCDGFSFKDSNGHRLPARHISTDYISPETTRHKLNPSTLGENQDNYALGVILFQLFNYAQHPFQGTSIDVELETTTNDEHAAAGLYPYGLVANKLIKPRRGSTHACMPSKLREMFDRTFTGNPLDRVTPSEWYSFFDNIIQKKNLARCEKNPTDPMHVQFKEGRCPECYRQQAKSNFESQALLRKPLGTKATAIPAQALPSTPASTKPAKENLSTKFILLSVVGFILLAYFNIKESSPSVYKNENSPNTISRPAAPAATTTRPNDLSQVPSQDILTTVSSSRTTSSDGKIGYLTVYLSPTTSISSITGPRLFIVHRSCEPTIEETKLAQRALISLGFKVGIIDGIIGPATANAIRMFQRRKGIPESGKLDQVTAKLLNIDVSSYDRSNFKFHSRGTFRSSNSGPSIDFYGVPPYSALCYYVTKR